MYLYSDLPEVDILELVSFVHLQYSFPHTKGMATSAPGPTWLSKCLTVPPKYIQASIIISTGGILFGLDTGTIGPLTVMPQFDETFGILSSTVVCI